MEKTDQVEDHESHGPAVGPGDDQRPCIKIVMDPRRFLTPLQPPHVDDQTIIRIRVGFRDVRRDDTRGRASRQLIDSGRLTIYRGPIRSRDSGLPVACRQSQEADQEDHVQGTSGHGPHIT